MKELEKKMQNENFDVEVQYCDPDDCNYDCMVSENHCNSHISTLMQNQSESLNICEGEQEMKELEKKCKMRILMQKYSIVIQTIVLMTV